MTWYKIVDLTDLTLAKRYPSHGRRLSTGIDGKPSDVVNAVRMGNFSSARIKR